MALLGWLWLNIERARPQGEVVRSSELNSAVSPM
jgi:hypothetical protein